MSIVPWEKKINWVAQTLRKLNHEEICDKKLDWIFQVNAIPNFKVTKSARAKNTTFSRILKKKCSQPSFLSKLSQSCQISSDMYNFKPNIKQCDFN